VRIRAYLLITLLASSGAASVADTLEEVTRRDAAQTVVIANARVAESLELARYYMEVRGIPTNHLCVLDLPTGETMARRLYETELRDPLLAFLRERGLIEQVQREASSTGPHDSGWRTTAHRLRYVVSMYGVPLRVAGVRPFLLDKISRLVEEPFQRDNAALDSELACLLWESYELKGFVRNPIYNLLNAQQFERQSNPLLIAARLDGPGPDIVRGMIDDALEAERNGLHGRAYIDLRDSRDSDYQIGDFWMREAGHRLSRYGFDVVFQPSATLFQPLDMLEDAALYQGWYAEHVEGPFANEAFRFVPGAIAYHLHSGSAKTLRSRDQHWAGPLLARGAAAVMGAVDEPYLLYTPDLQIFTDRLVSGFSFGESAYLSQRSLSWMVTVVGDPLYRPFLMPVEERMKLLEAAEDPGVAWEHHRRMNLLADQHQLNIALAFGREMLTRTGHPALREKLADMYAKNNLWEDALREYRVVIEEADRDITAMRVGQRVIRLLQLLGRNVEADELSGSIHDRWPDSPFLAVLKTESP
jgi:uncharacterized protein (TIGR03790 family)